MFKWPTDMVRFYWRADVQKKAKIMRKVKFPMELDVSELASPKRRVNELLKKANPEAFPHRFVFTGSSLR
jgi:ubiquitin carboxyl-terminal hydrolase 14